MNNATFTRRSIYSILPALPTFPRTTAMADAPKWSGKWCWSRVHLPQPWNSYYYYRRTVELPGGPRVAKGRRAADNSTRIPGALRRRRRSRRLDVAGLRRDRSRRLAAAEAFGARGLAPVALSRATRHSAARAARARSDGDRRA